MARFRISVLYVIAHIPALALTLGDFETGTVRGNKAAGNESGFSEMRKGSRLRMFKTSNGIFLGGMRNETARPARDIVVEGPVASPTRGQTDVTRDVLYEGANESPASYRFFPNDFPSKAEIGPGERYYYNDLGAVVKDAMPDAEQMWRINDPRYARIQPGPQPRHRFQPYVDKNSCRQYLEFLRYAFEQLDNPAKKLPNEDYYYYYDEEYNPGENRMLNGRTGGTKPPPVIIPDLGKLRSMAYNDNYGTQNVYSYVRNGYPNETEVSKMPATNRRTPQSTLVPVTLKPPPPSASTSKRPDEKAEESAMPPVEVSASYSGSPADDAPLANRVGIESTTESPEDGGRDGCQDKLFPCPDNLNVTYPVNGYCNRFVVCESGKPNPEFCQEGLHFNLVTRQCDLPHNSFCTYSCPRAKGYFGVPGDCAGFFRCSDWYPEYRMCPPRMHWDYKAKICTFRELSSCPLKCELPYQVKPYSGDCGSYIICTRGEPIYHRCPDGTSFDRNVLKCVPKSDSNCIEDEDYITRNRGIENGRKTLCAKVELKEGKSSWCQETAEDHK